MKIIEKLKDKPAINIVILIVIIVAAVAGVLFVRMGEEPTPEEKQNTEVVESENQPVNLNIISEPVFVNDKEVSGFTEISIGKTIKTGEGGGADIVYPNGTTTKLDQNTEIVINKFSEEPFQAEVQVESGRIWSRITKLLGKESYETKSENLVASVRGTSYGHEILENGNDKLLVTEDDVFLECVLTDFVLEIQENYKADTNCATQPTAKQILNVDRDEWYVLNNRALGIVSSVRPSLTLTSTPTLAPTTTATATSTSTPIITPTPTPVPLSISTVSVDCSPYTSPPCGDNTHSIITINGTGFDQSALINAVDLQGNKVAADSPLKSTETIVTQNQIIAHFTNQLSGEYSMEVLQGTSSVLSGGTIRL